MNGTIVLKDGEAEDELLVDISLCFSPFNTYPWLQELNTVVSVVGYLEKCNNTCEQVRHHFE